jgi:hypothetical protein
MLWRKLTERYTNYMEIDPAKISLKLNELNDKYKPGNWEEVEGLSAFTAITASKNGDLSFYPGKGIPVKAFYNSETSEIKTFFAFDFANEDTDGQIS